MMHHLAFDFNLIQNRDDLCHITRRNYMRVTRVISLNTVKLPRFGRRRWLTFITPPGALSSHRDA